MIENDSHSEYILFICIWTITSFESVARMIADKYDATVEYIPMPEHLAKQYQRYTCADLTKLRQDIDL